MIREVDRLSEENENLKATWKKTKNDQILIENEAYWRFSPEVLSHDLDYFWVNRSIAFSFSPRR